MAFEAALACADSHTRESFWQFERRLWTQMLALGRALIVLFLGRQAERSRPAQYRRQGTSYRIQGERSRELGTRFGSQDSA